MADEILDEELTEKVVPDDAMEAVNGTAEERSNNPSGTEPDSEISDPSSLDGGAESVSERDAGGALESEDKKEKGGSGRSGTGASGGEDGDEELLDEYEKSKRLHERFQNIRNSNIQKEEEAKRAQQARRDELLETRNAMALKENSKVPHSIGTTQYINELERPRRQPVAKIEAEYAKRITKAYGWNVNIGETIFINSGSANFNKQFEKASRNYVQLEKGEFPILLYDRTVRMTASCGFVLTNRFIHIKQKDIHAYKARINRLEAIVVIFGETVNDWSELKVKQKGTRTLYPVFRSLNAERVAELAEFLFKMSYHLWPTCKAGIVFNGSIPDKESGDEDDESGLFKNIKSLFSMNSVKTDSSAHIWDDRYERRRRGEMIGPAKSANKGSSNDDEGKSRKNGKKSKGANKSDKDNKSDSGKGGKSKGSKKKKK